MLMKIALTTRMCKHTPTPTPHPHVQTHTKINNMKVGGDLLGRRHAEVGRKKRKRAMGFAFLATEYLINMYETVKE